MLLLVSSGDGLLLLESVGDGLLLLESAGDGLLLLDSSGDGLSPRRTGFNLRSVHLRFVVYMVAL